MFLRYQKVSLTLKTPNDHDQPTLQQQQQRRRPFILRHFVLDIRHVRRRALKIKKSSYSPSVGNYDLVVVVFVMKQN